MKLCSTLQYTVVELGVTVKQSEFYNDATNLDQKTYKVIQPDFLRLQLADAYLVINPQTVMYIFCQYSLNSGNFIILYL
jgi:hypothetical protein